MNHPQFQMPGPSAVRKDDPVDVSGLVLDPGVPQSLRGDYLSKATGNPCSFRVGDLDVELEFSESAPPLQDVLSTFLLRKKQGL